MIRWFGKSWGAPVNAQCEEAAVPVGAPCERCKKPIADGDRGIVFPMTAALGGTFAATYHIGCFLTACGARRGAEESPAA